MQKDEGEKERFTTYLTKEIKHEIMELSKETRIPQARLFEEACRDLIEKYKAKESSNS